MRDDNKLPKDYRVQDGCWNCPHVFVYFDHGEKDTFYCTFDTPKRLPCMSLAMHDDEFVGPLRSSDYKKAHDAWDDWSRGREVAACGTCRNRKAGR